jgi:beta-lactamase regulating signal transducer with metallopeptidase domain
VWAATAAAIYLAGLGILLVRLAMGLRRARAIRREAVRTQGRLTHPACVTPITVGFTAPVVILPPDWADWDGAELSAVLTHEEEHVRRRDPLVAAFASFNRALFWFHPLAWWLQREIGRLAEQACDAVVVGRGHDSDVYAACLLRFARRAIEAGGRISPMAAAMPGSGLHERLGMLVGPLASPPSRARLTGAVAVLAGAVVMCAAATPAATPLQAIPSAANQATWAVEASEHFEVLHNGLPESLVSDAVREAEAAYTQLSTALRHDLPWPVTILLVSGDGDLPATQAAARDLIVRSGAQAPHHIVMSLESLARRNAILVHELTHVFAFEIVPNTSRDDPSLIEGLAEYQRGAWQEADLRLAREAVAAGEIPTVGSAAGTERHWAHAIFDFVAARRDAEGIRQLLLALRTHDTLAQAVPMAFNVGLDEFDREYRGYVTARFGRP